jgi:hypothetical protein
LSALFTDMITDPGVQVYDKYYRMNESVSFLKPVFPKCVSQDFFLCFPEQP